MALPRQNRTLVTRASKHDLEETIAGVEDRIDALEVDIASINNNGGNPEIVAARNGMPTLTDRLNKIYNFLPNVSYESYNDSPSNAITFYQISMSWKGKVYYFSYVRFDFDDIHKTETANSHYLSVICWDISNHVFVHKLYSELTAQFMPVFQIIGRNFHVRCVVFFDQFFNYVDCSSGEIIGKNCFAWIPGEYKPYAYYETPVINKIENSVIDFSGIMCFFNRSGTKDSNPYITINNSIIKNYNPIEFFNYSIQQRYNPNVNTALKISGNGNDIEMLRPCPGEFQHGGGINILRIPYDTADDYWKVYVQSQEKFLAPIIDHFDEGLNVYIGGKHVPWIRRIRRSGKLNVNTYYPVPQDCQVYIYISVTSGNGGFYTYRGFFNLPNTVAGFDSTYNIGDNTNQYVLTYQKQTIGARSCEFKIYHKISWDETQDKVNQIQYTYSLNNDYSINADMFLTFYKTGEPSHY